VTIDPPERQAARQLESFFLRQFLAEARPESSFLGGGFAGDTFRDMLDTALSDAMSAAGGLGLAATFESSLGGEPRAAATVPLRSFDDLRLETSASPPDAGFVRPVSGRISSRFGVRVDPIRETHTAHHGLDIAAPEGAPVLAARAGTVERAGDAGTYGNLVILRHPDGSETRYAHLSAVDVRRGDHVAAGAPIGKVGSTGRSTGPHLHFEVRRDGRPIDPWPLFQDQSADSPSTDSGSGRP
jgi:murein DD-endopeptidase MepM/ murein hydrolase activator NlpD